MIIRKQNIFELFYLLIISFIVITVIYNLQYLRPSGDDYCFGANVAEFGIFGGVAHWWNTWSGFIFSMVSGNLFVGLPLAYFSLNVASAIPFLCASFGMGLVFIFIQNLKKKYYYLLFFIVVNIAFLWWVYLWSSPLINNKISSNVFVSHGLTFWQTLNGQYVIVIQFFILTFYYLLRIKANEKSSFYYFFLIVIVGILSGTTGSTLSLSFLTICIYKLLESNCKLIFTTNLNKINFIQRKNLKFWFYLSISILIGVFISHLISPGSQIRVAHLSPNYNLDINRIFEIIKTVFNDGIKIWAKAYFNYGALITFIIALGIFIQIRKKLQIIFREDNLTIALYLTFFALLQCFINRFSEVFTYQGYWHYVSPIVCIFLSLLFFSAYASKYLVIFEKSLKMYIFYLIFFSSLVLGIASSDLMVKSINFRYANWIIGPAPLDGISDISTGKNNWEDNCWEKLNSLRSNSINRYR